MNKEEIRKEIDKGYGRTLVDFDPEVIKKLGREKAELIKELDFWLDQYLKNQEKP